MRVVLLGYLFVDGRVVFLHVEDVDGPQALETSGNILGDAEHELDGGDILGLLDDFLGSELGTAVEHDGFYHFVLVAEVRIKRLLGNLEVGADVVHRAASQSVAKKNVGNAFDDFHRGAMVGEIGLRGFFWAVSSGRFP